MTLIMGYCGLRIGEVTALRAKDVKDRTITVRATVTKVPKLGYVEDDTKTHRTRWVPVPDIVWEKGKLDRCEKLVVTPVSSSGVGPRRWGR
jgi:integrase